MATREVSNGTRTVERWTNEGTAGYYTGNPLTKQRDLTTQEAADLAAMDTGNTQTANRVSLESKAASAVASNITYINLASPTTAQTTAQVKALSRQVNALIKLVLNQLDDTTGT